MSLIFLAFRCVVGSVFLIFYLHFFLSLLLFFFTISFFFPGQQDVIKNWKSSAKTWIRTSESEMSQGWTGCRKERIQETEVLAAHLESQLGWVGWSQTANPWSLFPLSWLVLSASQGCMCVHITHSFWKLSLPRPLEGHVFSLYGIWRESRSPKSSKHWRADHPTPTSPGCPPLPQSCPSICPSFPSVPCPSLS